MEGLLTDIGIWLGEIGPWAYVLAPAVMAAVAVLPIPAEIPAMANGMIFGPVMGTAVSWTGSMIGAWISYELALGWGRPLAERFVSARSLEEVDGAASDAGWWGLLVLRFIPLVAFTAINWGAGLFAIPRGRFLWTTGVGILPGAVVFTSSGSGLGALYRSAPGAAVAVFTVVAIAVGAGWLRRRRRIAES